MYAKIMKKSWKPITMHDPIPTLPLRLARRVEKGNVKKPIKYERYANLYTEAPPYFLITLPTTLIWMMALKKPQMPMVKPI